MAEPTEPWRSTASPTESNGGAAIQAVLINGDPTGLISPSDRGLNYGDGLFETVAVFSARPCLWQLHLDRLHSGCERLGIPAPSADRLEADLERLLSSTPNALSRSWVYKIVLTRGSAGRGYRPEPDTTPLRISSLHAWPDGPRGMVNPGLTVRTCNTRLGHNPALAGLKHLCRLEQVLARSEWLDPTVAEGLMLDHTGHVIEATSSNLFLQSDGRLITPDLQACGVAGVVRALILELAEQNGAPVRISAVTVTDLANAEALYLCNSIAGIRRIACWDGFEYDPNLPVPRPLVSAMERIHSPC